MSRQNLIVSSWQVLVLAVFARIHAQDRWEENSDMIDIKPKIESNEQIKVREHLL